VNARAASDARPGVRRRKPRLQKAHEGELRRFDDDAGPARGQGLAIDQKGAGAAARGFGGSPIVDDPGEICRASRVERSHARQPSLWITRDAAADDARNVGQREAAAR